VVDEHLLTAELKMWMAISPATPPAAPGDRLLLGDADQDHAEAALALGGLKVAARDQLLGLALAEPQHGDPITLDVAIDRGHVGAAEPAKQRRRRDRVAAIQQKAHDLKRRHQLGHIGLQEQPIDRAHPQRDVIPQ
jgi:hypothetical protein